MKNIEEFYILGLPIETEIGMANFIKIKDYPEYRTHLSVLSLTKNHILVNSENQSKEFIDRLNEMSMFELIISIPEVSNYYAGLFIKVFDTEECLLKITNDNFDYYRNLLMKMHCVQEEKINPNPEIQRWIEKSKRLKQSGDPIDFTDMVTSIVGHNGLTYLDISEMTLYQLISTFKRITKIKNYDTSTLFATVSTKEINIESWFAHIDLFEEEEHGISREEFNNQSNSLFGRH